MKRIIVRIDIRDEDGEMVAIQRVLIPQEMQNPGVFQCAITDAGEQLRSAWCQRMYGAEQQG